MVKLSELASIEVDPVILEEGVHVIIIVDVRGCKDGSLIGVGAN